MRIFCVFLTFCLVFIVSGCSGDKASQNAASLEILEDDIVLYGVCDHRAHPDPLKRQCREWYGDFYEILNLEFTCQQITSGIFSFDHCTDKDLLGVCEVSTTDTSQVKFFYYSDVWTMSKAKDHCATTYLKSQWVELVP